MRTERSQFTLTTTNGYGVLLHLGVPSEHNALQALSVNEVRRHFSNGCCSSAIPNLQAKQAPASLADPRL